MPLQSNLNRFKEPRGFIKVLQFFIAILAFATTAGYYTEFKFEGTFLCNNQTNHGVHIKRVRFDYPFDDIDYYIDSIINCSTGKKGYVGQDKINDFKSKSEFFVFVGVISFFYCIVAMVYYVFFEDPAKYGPGGTGRDLKSFSTVDFVVTLILAFFWFCASVAWAVGLTGLKDDADAENYIKNAKLCQKPFECTVLKKAGFATLTISVLFGFLNCFLWCANTWYVYKETVWHREPGATATSEQPSAEIPRQQVPEEESIQ